MSEFRMKAKHLIHLPQFDEEHRQLFEIVDVLRKSLMQPNAMDSVHGSFALLESHTRMHFANEERVMQRYGYPGFYAHRQMHANLLDQLAEMMMLFDRARLGAARLLNTSVAIWLTGHITSEDARFGRYVLACEREMLPAAS